MLFWFISFSLFAFFLKKKKHWTLIRNSVTGYSNVEQPVNWKLVLARKSWLEREQSSFWFIFSKTDVLPSFLEYTVAPKYLLRPNNTDFFLRVIEKKLINNIELVCSDVVFSVIHDACCDINSCLPFRFRNIRIQLRWSRAIIIKQRCYRWLSDYPLEMTCMRHLDKLVCFHFTILFNLSLRIHPLLVLLEKVDSLA